jgi:hypothetical protein
MVPERDDVRLTQLSIGYERNHRWDDPSDRQLRVECPDEADMGRIGCMPGPGHGA